MNTKQNNTHAVEGTNCILPRHVEINNGIVIETISTIVGYWDIEENVFTPRYVHCFQKEAIDGREKSEHDSITKHIPFRKGCEILKVLIVNNVAEGEINASAMIINAEGEEVDYDLPNDSVPPVGECPQRCRWMLQAINNACGTMLFEIPQKPLVSVNEAFSSQESSGKKEEEKHAPGKERKVIRGTTARKEATIKLPDPGKRITKEVGSKKEPMISVSEVNRLLKENGMLLGFDAKGKACIVFLSNAVV